ncbi:MAG: hypothetical protein H7Y18_14620 [Clostridiaceae bacterium]|nr:hypothetical protein [Clostridiaceae bacterium]
MKRFISLLLPLLIILLLISCTSKSALKKFNYEGLGGNWHISEEFNEGGTIKVFIKYIGNSTPPQKVNFIFEHLSTITSGGYCEYSKTLDGYNIVFDDKLNDDIKKYANNETLETTINWNKQDEKIALKKVK